MIGEWIPCENKIAKTFGQIMSEKGDPALQFSEKGRIMEQRGGVAKSFLECLAKFNPYHDEKGRFAAAPGKAGGFGVQTVGHIDIEKYRCVTDDITTDEVIITDERIQHIKERHPGDWERVMGYIPQIIDYPDYIIEANKPNTAVILKELEENGEKYKLILRLKVGSDPIEYKNSIMSFWCIGETTWKKNLKNKKVLYRRE